jgi:pectinesterase
MIYEIDHSYSINEIVKKMKKNDILILNDGIYNEKVYITNNDITIKSKNPHMAIIQNKDYYHKIMENNNECNTFGTYTVYVGGNNVTLDGLHIKNLSTPSRIYGQAVALHADGNHFICKNSIIESAQDTLFTGPLPKDLQIRYKGFHTNDILKPTYSFQAYLNCKIIGDVDFIFGCATALFKQCEIIAIDNNSSHSPYLTAPAHDIDQPYGYLFLNCNINCHKPSYLSRPWRDYGCVAFIDNVLDCNIVPEGFDKWNNSNRDKTARFYEYSPNIDTSKRVSWSNQLTKEQSEQYTYNFLKYIDFESWVK